MNLPRVSVIMSVHNGERYLREAIESILGQTFTDFEFIIVDDASTDGSLEIMQSYDDARIKIIKNEKNIGLTKSLNIAIGQAQGGLVARQDADDVSLPGRLEAQFKYFEQNPDVSLLGTGIFIIDESGKILGRRTLPEDPSKNYFRGSWFAHGSVMFKTGAVRGLGGYNELLRYCQDYELWLRIAKGHKVRGLAQGLYKLRYHDANIQFTKRGEAALYHLLSLRLTGDAPDEAALKAVNEGGINSLYPYLKKGERIFYHKALAYVHMRNKNMKLAREEYKKVLKLNPLDFKNGLNLLMSYIGRRLWAAAHRIYDVVRYF